MDTTTEHGGEDRPEGLNPVEEIQTVPFDNPLSDEQTPPVFRVSITLGDGTFAVDFDHRQAAENWRSAIAALSRPAQPAAPDPSADGGSGGEVARDRFELWAETDNRSIAPLEFEERTDDNNCFYVDECDNNAFIGWKAALASRTPALGAAGVAGEGYQDRIGAWMDDVFAAGGADIRTRIDRYLEESFELAQSLGYDPGRIAAIRDYVFGRPVGVAPQETGGVMVTLASLCHAAGIDMMAEAERELTRIHTPEVRAKIMAKQASKNALHTPLPTAEAALAPQPQGPAPDGGVKALREALDSFPQGLVLDFDPKRPNMFWRRNGTSFTSDGEVERAVRDWAARVFRALTASSVNDPDGDAGGEVGS